MKKTLTVNIGGIVFYIDDDAFGILNDYLEEIGKFLKHSPNRDEIVADIENRIAEILRDRKRNENEAVNKDDVGYVIELLGQPGEFGEENEKRDYSYQRPAGNKKRLYRDVDEKMIGGVCSGLGKYFHIDPVIVRIIFVVAILLSGASFLAYLILWIVVPPAITPEEKKEMYGDPVDFSEIEESVKKEMKEVGKKLEDLANQFRNSFMKK